MNNKDCLSIYKVSGENQVDKLGTEVSPRWQPRRSFWRDIYILLFAHLLFQGKLIIIQWVLKNT